MGKLSHRASRDAEVQHLRAQAARYRWLALYVTDQNIAARITELADELEVKADELVGNSH